MVSSVLKRFALHLLVALVLFIIVVHGFQSEIELEEAESQNDTGWSQQRRQDELVDGPMDAIDHTDTYEDKIVQENLEEGDHVDVEQDQELFADEELPVESSVAAAVDYDEMVALGNTVVDETEPASDEKKKKEKMKPSITIFTGTHVPPAAERLDPGSQSVACQAVNAEIRNLWTHFGEPKKYVHTKTLLATLIGELTEKDQCIFASTPKNYLYTFPITMKSTAQCSKSVRKTLAEKKYVLGWSSVEASTRVTVNWFLLRPDLVTLELIAQEKGVDLKYFVTLGHDMETAAFAREGCPRFNTILANRDIYKQRLLLVALSDLNYQLSKLQYAQVVVNSCEDSIQAQSKLKIQNVTLDDLDNDALNVQYLDKQFRKDSRLECPKNPNSRGMDKLLASHVPSMLANDFFQGHKLRKTVFATKANNVPTLVFVAGVEGTGHHMFSLIGRKHTTRPLYEALTQYLCESAWTNDSWEQYGPARQNLIARMKDLFHEKMPGDGNVVFLNTVFSEQAVNMYSYPWGGPKCYLKKFARVVCNIDLYELARMAEEAGVDFRVVVLKRALGAAIVSSSINRNFGTVVSQTRMLGSSWALLRTSLKTLDEAFYESFWYEELIQKPRESADRLYKHLNIDPSSILGKQVEKTLTESNREYGDKNVNSWKSKVDVNQYTLISDHLYFSKEEKQAWFKEKKLNL